jgi:uncharacterized membrane protein YgcG
MTAPMNRQFLSLLLSVTLVTGSLQILSGYQTPPSTPESDVGTPTEPAPQSESQLEALVAPIALYPDPLVAQILAAATFPDQVAIANYWVQQNKNLTGTALTQAVDQQSWDPSVKALTQFASVLANLANNLAWTSSLGEAYHNQQAAVMSAIQALRAKAQAAGNLKSTPQITVVQQAPQEIVIQPANPQIVYVPQYNPAVIYGYPYVTPGYTAADVAAVGLLSFGAGIAIGAAMSSSWGWNSWACGWHGGAVVYHGGVYYGNAAWHGGYYNGGYHGSYGYNNYNNYNHNNYNNYNHNNSYNNASNSFNRNSGNSYNKTVNNNVNVNRSSGGDSWSHANTGSSTAFSGMSGRSGGLGGSSGGGWSSRAESNRGWGSMRSSGFSGGGGFGGFRGGGGRR